MSNRIAERAYEKWQLRGCPLWDDESDWFAAQSELEAEARVEALGQQKARMKMNPETERLKKELKRDVRDTLAGLRALRDELRLQIHLGGMDARRRWDELELDFAKVQSAAKRATDASVVALREAYLDLKKSLERPDRN